MEKFTNDFSEEVWATTYKLKDESSVSDSWLRVAKATSAVESKEKRDEWSSNFYNLLSNFRFVPGGRILANLGNKDWNTTLFNCFVSHIQDLDIEDPDSLHGIYTMLEKQAQTLKSEGGYGTNGSWIRPEGTYVYGIGSRTPGPLKFMELWDKSSEIITAGSVKLLGGKKPEEKNRIRKGAQMLILECWHPDIKDFIIAKQTPNKFTKFNVSVGITDGFMDAVENDGDWELKFPVTTHPAYKKEWRGNIEKWMSSGYPVEVFEVIKARVLWDMIMKASYNRNEPGVIYLDLVNKLNPISYAEDVRTTNPCGEIPMSTGVCCLGSLNLTTFVKDCKFDYEEFKTAVKHGIRFLDNVQDISKTPLPEYQQSVIRKRRIGLGVMGLGSIHFMLGIRYGSKKSLALVESIFRTKAETEILYSSLLGEEKGSFLDFDASKHFKTFYWKNLDISPEVKAEVEKIGCMRNSHQSMNAPTGNTSILANNASGGIEPVFMKEYIRWSVVHEQAQAELIKQGLKFPLVSKGEWFETNVFKSARRGDELILRGTFNGVKYEIDQNRGLVKATVIEDYGWAYAKKHLSDLADKEKDGVFATTESLGVEEHVNVLAVISKFTNQACSKTVNVPNNYEYKNFEGLYLNAYKMGIKGMTTYREGTMTAVLESKESGEKSGHILNRTTPPKRPTKLKGEIFTLKHKNQNLYVAVGFWGDDRHSVYEVFTGFNKRHFVEHSKGVIEKRARGKYFFMADDGHEYELTNGHSDENADALCRVLSASLRHGCDISFLIHQLEKTEGGLMSFAKVICRVLKKFVKDGTKVHGQSCESCNGNKIVRMEGCIKCSDCGWSKCG
jgi:ribonucleoside-diphosphate reductase alpha chain